MTGIDSVNNSEQSAFIIIPISVTRYKQIMLVLKKKQTLTLQITKITSLNLACPGLESFLRSRGEPNNRFSHPYAQYAHLRRAADASPYYITQYFSHEILIFDFTFLLMEKILQQTTDLLMQFQYILNVLTKAVFYSFCLCHTFQTIWAALFYLLSKSIQFPGLRHQRRPRLRFRRHYDSTG